MKAETKALCGLTALLGAAGATAGAIAGARSAQAQLSHGTMGGYSFNDRTACQQVDPGHFVDPISVAFVGQAPWQATVDKLNQSSNWNVAAGGAFQYFYEYGICAGQLYSQASEGSGSRWHVRGSDDSFDSYWGTFNVGTPHWDQAISPADALKGCLTVIPPGIEGHYVPENYQGLGYSGFVAARQRLVSDMLALSPPLTGPYWYQWYNTLPMLQCNGQQPQGDGWVAYLQMGQLPTPTPTPPPPPGGGGCGKTPC